MKSVYLLFLLKTCSSLRFNEVSEKVEEWSESEGSRRRRRRKNGGGGNIQQVWSFDGAKAEDADGTKFAAFKAEIAKDLGDVAFANFRISMANLAETAESVAAKMAATVGISDWNYASSLIEAKTEKKRAKFAQLISWNADAGWTRASGRAIDSRDFETFFNSGAITAKIRTAFQASATRGQNAAFVGYGIDVDSDATMTTVTKSYTAWTWTGSMLVTTALTQVGGFTPVNTDFINAAANPGTYLAFTGALADGLAATFGVDRGSVSLTSLNRALKLAQFQLTWKFETTCNAAADAEFAKHIYEQAFGTADINTDAALPLPAAILASAAKEFKIDPNRLSMTAGAFSSNLDAQKAKDCDEVRSFTFDMTYSSADVADPDAEGEKMHAAFIEAAADAGEALRLASFKNIMGAMGKDGVLSVDLGSKEKQVDDCGTATPTLTPLLSWVPTDGQTAEAAGNWNGADKYDVALMQNAAGEDAITVGNAAGFADDAAEIFRVTYSVSVRTTAGGDAKVKAAAALAQDFDGDFASNMKKQITDAGVLADIGVAVSDVSSDGFDNAAPASSTV